MMIIIIIEWKRSNINPMMALTKKTHMSFKSKFKHLT